MEGSTEMVDGYVFLLSPLWKYAADGVIQGEKWMSVGNDVMSKMISLYSIYSYVSFS